MTDVITRVGSNPVPAEDMSSADQDTVTGNGTSLRPLQANGSGGGGGLLVGAIKTATFTADAGNLYPLANAGAGTEVANLPLASSGNGVLAGFVVQDVGGGGGWSVEAQLGDTINTGDYALAATVGDYAEFISDGVHTWYLRSSIVI